MDEDLITIEQAIKDQYCGLSFSYHQLRTAIISGQLRAKKMANTWRLKKSWIMDWLDTPDVVISEEIQLGEITYKIDNPEPQKRTGGRKPNKLI